MWTLSEALTAFHEKDQFDTLNQGRFGIEREALRVKPDGRLALTPHPKSLSDPLTDPHITTDFSESQLEFVTAPHENIDDCLDELQDLQIKASLELNKNQEWLWPCSMPCRLPESDDIPIAQYGDSPDGKRRELYRQGLAHRYGKPMQTLCGIHFNLSFSDDVWKILQSLTSMEDLQDVKNEGYLATVRNFVQHRWILVYLFGASPQMDPSSYRCPKMANNKTNAVSLRLSRCGYSNPSEVPVRYNHFADYIHDLRQAVDTPNPDYKDIPEQLNDHLLQIVNEYYFPIRIKADKKHNDFLEGLEADGAAYLEVRLLDVDPFHYTGVSSQQLHFMHLFMLFCLLSKSPELSPEEIKTTHDQQEYLAYHGQNIGTKLRSKGERFLKALQPLAQFLDQAEDSPGYTEILEHYREEFIAPESLAWKRHLNEMALYNDDFIQFGLRLAQNYHDDVIRSL
jgi:glutamate--cysteine ligase